MDIICLRMVQHHTQEAMVQLICTLIDLISLLLLATTVVRLLLCEWGGLLLSNLVVPYEPTRITGATTTWDLYPWQLLLTSHTV